MRVRSPMRRASLYFTAPRAVELRVEECASPGNGEVLVQTLLSAISPGTELLVYRGQAPAEMAADETLPALGGSLAFPLKYGYSAVGRVLAIGPNVESSWRERTVFAFNPHETSFIANASDVIPLPIDLALEDAVFLPNMETAVNFLHDGAPLVGENVAVFGQGIVGLLTTSLLARIPLARLVTFDRYPLRRSLSLQSGAHESLDPQSIQSLISNLQPLTPNPQPLALRPTETPNPQHFDLTYELSGSPAALDQAIAVTGFDGRIVVGSWYGTKRASLDLGGRFHRSRIKLISSQVSTLSPGLAGRWTKARRLQTALQLLAEIEPSRFITHRFPFDRAAQAYALLDQRPDDVVQAVLVYNQSE